MVSTANDTEQQYLLMKKRDGEKKGLELIGDMNEPMTRSEADEKMKMLIQEDSSIEYIVVPMIDEPDGEGYS